MLIKKRHRACIGLCVILFLLIPVHTMAYTAGKVVDFFTKKPVTGAFITVNQYGVLTGQNGSFTVNTELNKLAVRAPGYRRVEQIITTPLNRISHEIKLISFNPKGLSLSFFGIGDRGLRGSAVNP